MIRKNGEELAKETLREHRMLQELFQSLARLAARGSPPTMDRSEAVALSLKNLHERLVCHFELEEEGQLFEDLRERLPMVDDVIGGLRRDHTDFLETVVSLIGRFERADAEEFKAIREDLDRFVEAFQEHEETENELLQRAYYLDLGDAG